MKYFVYLILFAAFLFSIFLNTIGIIDLVLLCVSDVLLVAFLQEKRVENNVSKYIYLCLIFTSVILLPSFHWVVIKRYTITQLDYNHLMSFGIHVFFVAIVSSIVASLLIKRIKLKTTPIYKPKHLSSNGIKLFFILIFALTAFSYAIGLGKMGGEAVVLPFHLGGIINIFRRYFVPLIFMILIENYIRRGKKISYSIFIWYLIWTIFETISWMSKGIILTNFLPVLICLYLYFRPPVKKIVIVLTPLVVGFLLLYPIIGVLRSEDTGGANIIQSIKNAQSESTEEEDDDNLFVLNPLNRTFLTSSHYIKDYSYIDENSLFDFSKAPLIFVSGGAAAFQTFVIDEYPSWAIHSSGTTGIMDPLLHGGYGLCYIMIILLAFFACFIDRTYPKQHYSIYIILLLFLVDFILGENISCLYSGISLQTMVARIVAIVIAYRINFKNVRA